MPKNGNVLAEGSPYRGQSVGLRVLRFTDQHGVVANIALGPKKPNRTRSRGVDQIAQEGRAPAATFRDLRIHVLRSTVTSRNRQQPQGD